jgi:polyphosphate kinase
MPRNLERRVEVLVPVLHPRHRDWLDQVLEFDLHDDVVRWELDADDTWHRRGPADGFSPDAQELMYRWASERQLASRR